MPLVYLQTTDGARIPIQVDAEGRLVLAPTGTIAIGSDVDTRIWAFNGTTWEKVRSDPITQTMQTIAYEHHEIHGGDHFFYENFTSLDDTNTADFGILTPNTTTWTHMTWEIQTQGLVTFQVYEGSTITWDGSDLTSRNNNRNSANVSTWVEFQLNPSVVAVGTLLAQAQVGDATSPVRGIPGGGKRSNELILKQNTAYLFRITSGVDGNVITYQAEWYEHTNK